MNPETIETLKVIAAVLAACATVLWSAYIVITRPLLKAMETQSKSMDGALAAQSKSIDAAFTAFRAEITASIKSEFSALRADMKDMESRLDKRIDTHVVRKG